MPTSDIVGILPLRSALLGCRDCKLRATCQNPVPWSGPEKCDVLFLGEAPGEREDISMRPWSGQAGREFDNYLWHIGIDRDDVRCSNVTRCRPPGNRDPEWEEVEACWQWTTREIAQCDPKVVVLLGRIAIRAFLGSVDVGSTHGNFYDVVIPMPHLGPGVERNQTVFCITHPAAGLHNIREVKNITEDFKKLRQFLDTGQVERVQDEYPEPEYRELKGEQDSRWLIDQMTERGHCSADTENTPDGKFWCASISVQPGQAFVIWPEDIGRYKEVFEHYTTTTLHFAQHDVEMLRTVDIHLPGHLLGDTMIGAYVLGYPQSLKQLAYQYCGMNMEDYMEVVGPYQFDVTVKFL